MMQVNALIKRASLYIQQCKDPSKDPAMSLEDFALAEELDPENADIYNHRCTSGNNFNFRSQIKDELG